MAEATKKAECRLDICVIGGLSLSHFKIILKAVTVWRHRFLLVKGRNLFVCPVWLITFRESNHQAFETRHRHIVMWCVVFLRSAIFTGLLRGRSLCSSSLYRGVLKKNRVKSAKFDRLLAGIVRFLQPRWTRKLFILTMEKLPCQVATIEHERIKLVEETLHVAKLDTF